MIEKTLAAVGAADLAVGPFPICRAESGSACCSRRRFLASRSSCCSTSRLSVSIIRYQEAVIDLVRRFARERNITVLFSAHELNQLIGTLDRVLYLGNGHAALGTVAEVATAPVLSQLYGTEIEVVRAERAYLRALSRPRRRALRSCA